jgi:hypothetical protein
LCVGGGVGARYWKMDCGCGGTWWAPPPYPKTADLFVEL